MQKIFLKPVINVYKLILHLNKKLKREFLYLLFFILISSLLEIISVTSIIPFLVTLSNPQVTQNNKYINFLNQFLSIEFTLNQLILLSCLVFIILILVSLFTKLYTLNKIKNFSAASTNYLSLKIFKNFFNQSFDFYYKNNSKDILNLLTTEIIRIAGVISSLLDIIIGCVLILFIITGLFAVNFSATFFTLIVIIFSYIYLIKKIQKRLRNNSKIVSKKSAEILKIIQESFGGIRELILDNKQSFIANNYNKVDFKLRFVIEESKFIKKFPKFLIESVGLIILSSLSIIIIVLQKNENYIPTLGFIAFAFQKLLSSCSQVYGSWSAIAASEQTILSALKYLNLQRMSKVQSVSKKLSFNNEIILENISFKFRENEKIILKNINIKIKKGERIGIVGKTGSGKSTFLDIFNGLLLPTNGKIFVDNINLHDKNYSQLSNWQRKIAHVPQNIFLADDTLINNIGFGIEPNLISKEKIYDAAIKSSIYKDIKLMPNGFESFVGERGATLSGGQIQRLGIARALYKNKEILILDESTSSLDSKTEIEISNMLNKLPKELTIIIIAHKFKILGNCDTIYELKEGKLEVLKIS